jgi:hypothetical protein
MIDEVERLYAPPDHPVFNLLPPPVYDVVHEKWVKRGSEVVTETNIWDQYQGLVVDIALDLETSFRNTGENPDGPFQLLRAHLRDGRDESGDGGGNLNVALTQEEEREWHERFVNAELGEEMEALGYLGGAPIEQVREMEDEDDDREREHADIPYADFTDEE